MRIVKILGKTLGLSTVLTVGAIGGIYATALAYATRPDELTDALNYFKDKYEGYKPKIDEAKKQVKNTTEKILSSIDKAMNPSIESLMEELQKQADILASISPDYKFTSKDDEATYCDCDCDDSEDHDNVG